MENNMVETEKKDWPNLQNKWLFALRQVGLVFLWSYSAALSTRSQKKFLDFVMNDVSWAPTFDWEIIGYLTKTHQGLGQLQIFQTTMLTHSRRYCSYSSSYLFTKKGKKLRKCVIQNKLSEYIPFSFNLTFVS